MGKRSRSSYYNDRDEESHGNRSGRRPPAQSHQQASSNRAPDILHMPPLIPWQYDQTDPMPTTHRPPASFQPVGRPVQQTAMESYERPASCQPPSPHTLQPARGFSDKRRKPGYDTGPGCTAAHTQRLDPNPPRYASDFPPHLSSGLASHTQFPGHTHPPSHSTQEPNQAHSSYGTNGHAQQNSNYGRSAYDAGNGLDQLAPMPPHAPVHAPLATHPSRSAHVTPHRQRLGTKGHAERVSPGRLDQGPQSHQLMQSLYALPQSRSAHATPHRSDPDLKGQQHSRSAHVTPQQPPVTGAGRSQLHGAQQTQTLRSAPDNRHHTQSLQGEELLYAPLTWATQRPSIRGAFYTQITSEIVDHVTANQPSRLDIALRHVMVRLVTEAVKAALPEHRNSMQVLPFGSFVSGLGTRSSDLDVVVVGVCEPAYGQPFYDKGDRNQVAKVLDRIARELRRARGLRVHDLLIIRHSRIPLVKAELRLEGANMHRDQVAALPSGVRISDLTGMAAVAVDISVATDSGPLAAKYMAEQSHKYPSLRPLCLVIKAFLKKLNMNEVATGGLSSYGLTYMVIAHLMEEQRLGHDLQDLGWLLHRFFMRYGQSFAPHSEAVSVIAGGVVPRTRVISCKHNNRDRICCVEPLTGRNVTDGCFRSAEVLAALQRAAGLLDRRADRCRQGCPTGVAILDSLMRKPSYHEEDEDLDDEDHPQAGGAGGARGAEEEAGVKRARVLPGLDLPPAKMYAYTYPSAGQQAHVPVPVPAPIPHGAHDCTTDRALPTAAAPYYHAAPLAPAAGSHTHQSAGACGAPRSQSAGRLQGTKRGVEEAGRGRDNGYGVRGGGNTRGRR